MLNVNLSRLHVHLDLSYMYNTPGYNITISKTDMCKYPGVNTLALPRQIHVHEEIKTVRVYMCIVYMYFVFSAFEGDD